MDYNSNESIQQFKNNVALKFLLYNSLFTALPFHRIEKTGILLSVLLSECEEGYRNKKSPTEIIEEFFQKHTTYKKEQEQTDMLFRFVQYVERQVVLFDALEDAAFTQVRDMEGAGTLKHLALTVAQEKKEKELEKKISDFSVRIVLTAHPTQFYPGPVLGIITDLSKALTNNDSTLVNSYLQQLGKTPFLQKKQPTPFDEAMSLIWYLENVFYNTAGYIASFIENNMAENVSNTLPPVTLGFWPGGDRDGNPFVTADITMQVANALRSSIIKCYYREVRQLKKRLTFKGTYTILNNIEKDLFNNITMPADKTMLTVPYLLQQLENIKNILIYEHNGLFIHLLKNLINKIGIFGLHFASLDIRQESSVHGHVLNTIFGVAYMDLSIEEKIKFLTAPPTADAATATADAITKDTLTNISTIKKIQLQNGEQACNRYIISQCNSALNVLEVYGLFLACGWQHDNLQIDIIPLFETIDDLKHTEAIMETLYCNNIYRHHLQNRKNTQIIMLGFSDGTKDGGYLMANFSIYKAKESLTAISKKHNINVIFFDGRGGPPARGGGKTQQFYASMGKNISNKQIQLTIQGQTISSNFGTEDVARYNIEQLIHAGISNQLFSTKETTLEKDEESTLAFLAEKSYEAYTVLKNHPQFLNYLIELSPLTYYSETNIASRPSKRKAGKRITLADLRAIPFVGAWSQIKQNLTGYYGVGYALAAAEKDGNFKKTKDLYHNSLFFKTLIDNCEMAMKKCFFPLTAFLQDDEKFGEIWNMVYSEFELTKKYIYLLKGSSELMDGYPVDSMSITLREKIVLPLLTIQQYALNKIRKASEEANNNTPDIYKKLIIRSSFGIINAGRNSA